MGRKAKPKHESKLVGYTDGGERSSRIEAPKVRVRVRLHCVQKVLSVERQYILCRETMSSPSFPAKIKKSEKKLIVVSCAEL